MSDENSRSANRTSRFPKRRVLIVDDDPTFALLATETLERYGFKVKVAATATDAVTAFTSFNPDLVLLDVELPGSNGFDICRTMRAGQLNVDVPIVMVTGHDDTASIAQAYEAGATDFIHKPVLWPTLPHRVGFILRALDNLPRSGAQREQRNRALLQALPDAIFIVDQRGYIIEHITGSDNRMNAHFVGKQLEDVLPAELASAARRAIVEAASGAADLQRRIRVGRGKASDAFEARLRPQADGTLLIVTRDTTERQKAKARIEYLAYYDILTGLPNRQQFVREAGSAIRATQADGTHAGAAVPGSRPLQAHQRQPRPFGRRCIAARTSRAGWSRAPTRELVPLASRRPAPGTGTRRAAGRR